MLIIIKEWLNNLLIRLIVIFSAFFIRPNKIKKALKFLLLRTINNNDGMSINSTFISLKQLSSRLLSRLNFVPLKLAMY